MDNVGLERFWHLENKYLYWTLLFVNIGVALTVALNQTQSNSFFAGAVMLIAGSVGFVFMFLAAQHVFKRTQKFDLTVGSGALFGLILFVTLPVVEAMVLAALGSPDWPALSGKLGWSVIVGTLLGAVFFALAVIGMTFESFLGLSRSR